MILLGFSALAGYVVVVLTLFLDADIFMFF